MRFHRILLSAVICLLGRSLSLSFPPISHGVEEALWHTHVHIIIIYIALFLPADRFWFNYFRRVLILKLMPRFRCASTENCERIFHLWIDRRHHSIYIVLKTSADSTEFGAGDSMKCVCFLEQNSKCLSLTCLRLHYSYPECMRREYCVRHRFPAVDGDYRWHLFSQLT